MFFLFRILVLVSLLIASAQAQFDFVARRDLRLRSLPSSMGVGDWNGDGHIDIVVQASDSQGYAGRGDGTFQTPILMPYANYFADVNGDGDSDLIAFGQGLAVYLGNGDGTFQLPVITPKLSFDIAELASGDFNGDGFMDVAAVQRQYNQQTSLYEPIGVQVLFGNGSGAFSPKNAARIAGSDFAFADFNRDGKTDILLRTSEGALEFRLGNGDGAFEPVPGPVLPRSEGSPVTALAAGDFNNDGIYDFCAGTNIYLGNGNGTYRADGQIPGGSGTITVLRTADWDGDGNLDLFVMSSAFRHPPLVAIQMGTGDGHFSAPSYSKLGIRPGGDIYPDFSVKLEDINEDGVKDLVLLNMDGVSVSIAYGNPDGTIRLAQTLEQLATDAMVVADLNGDGIQDILCVSGSQVKLIAGKGDATFSPAVVIPSKAVLASGGYRGPIAAADFNGDGLTDFAVQTRFTSVFTVSLNLGAGAFTESPLSTPSNLLNRLIAADLNRDGRPDLIGGGSDALVIWINNGNGGFGVPKRVGVAANHIAVADWNNDGKPDLAVISIPTSADSPISLLAGNGDGTFQDPVKIGEGAGIAAGDFNGDGRPDLAFLSITPGFFELASVGVMPGNADGTFGTPRLISIGMMHASTYPVLVAEDLNGDGLTDLAWGVYNHVGLFAGHRENLLLPPMFVGAVPSLAVLAAADLNHDGRLDLVAGGPFFPFESSEGDIGILVNNQQP